MPVPVFCCFCISEKLFWKYSRNWTKRSPKSLFCCHVHGVRRRHEVGRGGSHTMWRRGLPPGRTTTWCGPLGRPPTSPFRLYIASDAKPLKESTFFEKEFRSSATIENPSSGDRNLCSGTLSGRGIAPGGHLHRLYRHLHCRC